MKSMLFICIAALFLISCASTGGKFVIEERQEGKSLLVGAVLIEVDGYDDLFESKTANITVVIVGKYVENGKELTRGYRIKTDENGYYILQNVPAGSYVVKGFEADVGYTSRFMVSAMWEGNMLRYFPTSNMIDHTVRVWPPEAKDEVIDLQITYLKLDRAERIIHDRFQALRNATLSLPNKTYMMPAPKEYFKSKYPEFEWIK